jgi:hypothetical protein
LAPLRRLIGAFDFFGGGTLGVCGQRRWWWWWDGEEGAFVGFGVADEGGDVMVGEERVGEDFRWWEAVDTYILLAVG